MAKVFNENEAFELHKAAVMRDFVAKPRLGMWDVRVQMEEQKCQWTSLTLAVLY